MTEQEALGFVLRNGKRTCVYSDDYNKLPKDLGMARYMDLRFFCKQQGAKDIREWLIAKGVYQTVERDMREGEGAVDWNGSAEEVCAQILERFPLAGEPILPEDALDKLFRRAQSIFDAVADYGKTELTNGERDVIAMAIVQHIKRRNLQEDGKADNQFWPYIYSQFGFRQENDRANTQHIYNVLRYAVRGAFLQHDRFFSSGQDTQQYYTSLRLHALTPVQSLESLFEILLFFYINDLEFNYTPEDPIFKALVECIATRWDRDIELQEELNVRSNAMASGLKALFRERPGFMRVYCERIVGRMDALVRGADVLSPDSALDALLSRWYAKKEDALKRRLSRERTGGYSGPRAVSSAESVRLRYVMDDRKVCISVPSIRLEHKADTCPTLKLYQGEEPIFAQEMEVFGRLSWTTRAMLIPMDATSLDYGRPLDIEATILYGGKTLLERDSRLHRSCIAFAEGGREISAQAAASGVCYLFANDAARIDMGTIEPEWIDHDGQLMRLYVQEGQTVYVDGAELFLSKDRQGDIRGYPTAPRVNGLRGALEGETFDIFPAPFKLDVRLPEGKPSLNYRAVIDGRIEPLARYCPNDARSFMLALPDKPAARHSVQIVELSSGRAVYGFAYAILPGAKCALESELIYDDGSPTTVRVRYEGCDITSRVYPAEGTSWVALSADLLDFDLEVKLPLVRGTLQGQNLFELPWLIWREKLSDADFLRLEYPADWSVRLFLGTTAVPQNAVDGSYELGNFIRSYRYRAKVDPLTLMLKNARGQQDTKLLTKIAFEEYFTESPVSVEEGSLMWRPEGKYVGGSGDEFQLVLEVPVEGSHFTYALDTRNATVDRRFGRDFPCGEFPFKVTKKSRSLFGAGGDRTLFEGLLAIGAPEQRGVLGKCLYLTRARCWDINVNRMVLLEMPQTAGCLCNLQFIGYSTPSGEAVDYPEYVGELYFYNPAAQDWQYFNDLERDGFETINPAHVWILSEQLIILRQADEEAPCIDRQYNSIVNRTLELPNHVLKYRIIPVDYFEYHME